MHAIGCRDFSVRDSYWMAIVMLTDIAHTEGPTSIFPQERWGIKRTAPWKTQLLYNANCNGLIKKTAVAPSKKPGQFIWESTEASPSLLASDAVFLYEQKLGFPLIVINTSEQSKMALLNRTWGCHSRNTKKTLNQHNKAASYTHAIIQMMPRGCCLHIPS